MSSAPLIEFIKVRKQFKDHPILSGVTFRVQPGDFVTITGPSGSGKSTLLSLLLGVVYPNEGDVFVAGRSVSSMNKHMLQVYRRTLGVVFQDYKLLPKKTVFENVAFALEVCALPEADIVKQVRSTLGLVGLGTKMSRYPHELSGGEQQRVAIARALVHNPSILLADEPTGNLDSKTSLSIIDLFKEIHKLGTTLILTTHNEEILGRLTGRRLEILEKQVKEV